MDSDEETAVVLWCMIQSLEEKPNRSFWVHPITSKRDIQSFIAELRCDENKFYNFCRLSTKTFDHLLELIGDNIKKQNTNYRKSIPPEERLLITLRFLATGERFQSLHYNFRIGATTAGQIVLETCTIIWEILSPLYMMTETSPEKWKQVADQFEELWNFPNCCGAIDGKHIRIESPWNSGSCYYNYKKFHSIVLQAVVDAEGNFLIVDVGDFGKNNDSSVFNSSTVGKLFRDHQLNLPKPRKLYSNKDTLFPYVFVGDEAYALNIHFMKPFSRASLKTRKKIYNYRHSRARRIVECAFGMMAKKFRIFERPMLVHPDTTKVITLACCVLHNMIRKREGKLAELYEEMSCLEECGEEHEANPARASKAAYAVRQKFVDFFNSPAGSVPWQNRMALCKLD